MHGTMNAPKPTNSQFSIFIKLLKMTTSPNDGEALNAIRMANQQLSKFGGDWEELLSGRVTIIADPFTSVPDLNPRARDAAPAPGTRPAPPPPPRPTPQPGLHPSQPPGWRPTT